MSDKSRKQKSSKPNIGLSDDNREAVASILQKVLADQYVLYTKLHNYHWNVSGPQFRSLHKMFQEQYETLALKIDETAERIRTYGVLTIGTMGEFIDHSRLDEEPGVYPDSRQMVMNLVGDHEAIIRALREDVEKVGETLGDPVAEDYLIELMEEHQEAAWMLRTFIEGKAVHE